MSKDTGDFKPHPGDPWHPDWVPGKEAEEEAFIEDTTETIEESARRGLLRRRRPQEAPTEPAAEPAEEYRGRFAEETSVGVYADLESLDPGAAADEEPDAAVTAPPLAVGEEATAVTSEPAADLEETAVEWPALTFDEPSEEAALIDEEEAAEPAAGHQPLEEAAEPAAAFEPVVEAAEPAAGYQPVVEAAQEPAAAFEPLVEEAEEPAAGYQPVEEAEEPAAAFEPVVEAAEPAAGYQPVEEVEEPAASFEPLVEEVVEAEEPAAAFEPLVEDVVEAAEEPVASFEPLVEEVVEAEEEAAAFEPVVEEVVEAEEPAAAYEPEVEAEEPAAAFEPLVEEVVEVEEPAAAFQPEVEAEEPAAAFEPVEEVEEPAAAFEPLVEEVVEAEEEPAAAFEPVVEAEEEAAGYQPVVEAEEPAAAFEPLVEEVVEAEEEAAAFEPAVEAAEPAAAFEPLVEEVVEAEEPAAAFEPLVESEKEIAAAYYQRLAVEAEEDRAAMLEPPSWPAAAIDPGADVDAEDFAAFAAGAAEPAPRGWWARLRGKKPLLPVADEPTLVGAEDLAVDSVVEAKDVPGKPGLLKRLFVTEETVLEEGWVSEALDRETEGAAVEVEPEAPAFLKRLFGATEEAAEERDGDEDQPTVEERLPELATAEEPGDHSLVTELATEEQDYGGIPLEEELAEAPGFWRRLFGGDVAGPPQDEVVAGQAEVDQPPDSGQPLIDLNEVESGAATEPTAVVSSSDEDTTRRTSRWKRIFGGKPDKDAPPVVIEPELEFEATGGGDDASTGATVAPGEAPGDSDLDDWIAFAGDSLEAEAPTAPTPEMGAPEEKAEKSGFWARRRAGKDAKIETAETTDEDVAPTEEPPDEGTPDDEGLDMTEGDYIAAATQEHAGLAAAIAEMALATGDELKAVAAAIPGVDSGVVGFEDVIDDDAATDVSAGTGRNLAVRIASGVLLAALFVGALWWSSAALGVLAGVVLVVALSEYYGVLLRNGHQPLAVFGLLGGLAMLFGVGAWGPIAIPGALIVTAIVLLFYYALEPARPDPLVNGGLTLVGMLWVVGFGAFVVAMLDAADFRILVFATVALTVVMDTAQFFAGRNWGRHKLSSQLSPNKTVEGLIGGIAVVLLTGAALGLQDPFDLTAGLVLAALVAAVAPLGDFAVSMLKRNLGVKDTGVIIPGHGGILDRIDALLFVLPVAWVAFSVMGYLA